jgi:voltage-gated potassium channel
MEESMEGHIVVIGYGTKGRSAVDTLLNDGASKESIVIVDPSKRALADAEADGIAAIAADGTRREVLRRAEVHRARQVLISLNRDDSTVLCTLTIRQLNRNVHVLAAVREQSNVALVRQSGADAVITSSEAVGRLLGLATVNPALGDVMGDLLTYGQGLEVAERDLLLEEVGKHPQQLSDRVIAVKRDGQVHRYSDPAVTQLARGDRLIVVRKHVPMPSDHPGGR